jgi:hypothetical protein
MNEWLTPAEYERLLERCSAPCGIEDSTEDVAVDTDARERASQDTERAREGRDAA